MEPLDGNSIGGLLIDVFGADMTGAIGTCGICGDTGPLAELVVYRQAPGTVVRCHSSTATTGPPRFSSYRNAQPAARNSSTEGTKP